MTAYTAASLQADNTAPAQSGEAITPSNTVNFTGGPSRAIWVGGSGTVVAVMVDGTALTLVGALAGTWLPLAAIRVNSTGTTATSLVAWR